MKYILLVIAFIACNTFAKTTYIPVYRTFIQINAQNDSIIESSKLMTAELISQDNTIRIYVQHEDVTKEKVKAIKRAKWLLVLRNFQQLFRQYPLHCLQKVQTSVTD